MIWLLLATIIWFAGRSFGGYTEETRHEYYLNLSMHYNDPNRKITMQNILKDASGIYVNSDKSRHDDIKKSVLMISIVSDEGRLGDPKLLNFLCYAKRFGLKVLVSILGAKNIDDSEFEQLMKSYGAYVSNFPMELFYSLLAGKSKLRHNRRAGQKGDYPLFGEHGYVLKLVPMLEILTLGYNVAYFDYDVALLFDPFPFMFSSTSDCVLSIEYRTCLNSTTSMLERENDVAWNYVEPNAGTMLVRANDRGVAFMRAWIMHTMSECWFQVQRSFMLFGNANVHDASCGCKYGLSEQSRMSLTDSSLIFSSSTIDRLTPYISPVSPADIHRDPLYPSTISYTASDSHHYLAASPPSVCYLSEILFQTGIFFMECDPEQSRHVYHRDGHMSNYTMLMKHHGIPITHSVTSKPHYYPVMAHLNPHSMQLYKTKKDNRFKSMGLWLYDVGRSTKEQLFCNPFVLENTYWGKYFSYD